MNNPALFGNNLALKRFCHHLENKNRADSENESARYKGMVPEEFR